MPFSFRPDSKFALLAFDGIYSEDLETESQLSDGTWLIPGIPTVTDLRSWEVWVGSHRADSLKRANLVLLVDRESNNPAVLDEEHIHLRNGLAQLYSFLRFHQGVEISGSKEPDLLCGSHLQGEPMIRQMTKMAMFYESKGYRRAPVTKERLEEALQLRSGLHAMQKTDEFQRIFRGIDVLFDRLKATGQNRLHQFVRSLEALILPDTGKTRKQFIHRCQTFASPGAATEAILREAFDMRSDAEHLHSWERAVMSYPKTERDDVCWQRTRQMQFLACDAYTKILLHPDIGNYFRTEQTLENFWKLGDQGTRSIWGKPVDLAREVRHSMYDQFGRPISAD